MEPIPVVVHRVRAGAYSSQRPLEGVEELVRAASDLLARSGLQLQLVRVDEPELSSELFDRIRDGIGKPTAPQIALLDSPGYDRCALNVYLISKMKALNGLPFPRLHSSLLVDHPKVAPARTLARSVCTILGLKSVGAKERLMASGTELTEEDCATLKAAGSRLLEAWGRDEPHQIFASLRAQAEEALASGRLGEAERLGKAARELVGKVDLTAHRIADVFYFEYRVNEARKGGVRGSIRALQVALQKADKSWSEWAHAMGSLALLHGAVDELSTSIELSHQLLVHLLRSRSPSDPEVLDARNTLATALSRSGSLPEAEREFLELLAWYRTLPEAPPGRMGLALYNLGGTYQRLERYEESLDCIARGRAGLLPTLAPDDPQRWLTRQKLASAHAWVGQHEQVELLMQAGIEEAERVLSPTHPVLVEAIYNYGTWLATQGREAESRQQVARAATIVERAHQP